MLLNKVLQMYDIVYIITYLFRLRHKIFIQHLRTSGGQGYDLDFINFLIEQSIM